MPMPQVMSPLLSKYGPGMAISSPSYHDVANTQARCGATFYIYYLLKKDYDA